jgi:DNA (cytosine-5)-methyltransferase 1
VKTVIDLFSGIGGFALGLESTGYFKTVQFVENEKWCQKILNKNFPEVPIHDDVKTFKGYGADVVVGGFPCQPFSVAGKQKAIQDDRHLWPDMFRVIKETKPTWVIGENVRNIISISEGMVLEQVYLDLESEGYEVQSFIIPASAVNAPHQRYRKWIVAHTDHGNHNEKKEIRTRGNTINSSSADVADTDSRLRGGRRTIGSSGENGQRGVHTTQEEQITHDLRSKTIRRNTVRGETKDVAHSISGNVEAGCKRQGRVRTESEKRRSSGYVANSSETMAHTDSKGLQRTEQHETYYGEAKTQFTIAKCFEERGYYWNTEPNVGRVANGIPNRVDRLKGLGNAIVPQIAYQIGKAIMEAENDNR